MSATLVSMESRLAQLCCGWDLALPALDEEVKRPSYGRED